MTTPRDALAAALHEGWQDDCHGPYNEASHTDWVLTALAAEGWGLVRENHAHFDGRCAFCTAEHVAPDLAPPKYCGTPCDRPPNHDGMHASWYDGMHDWPPAPDPAPLDVERLAWAYNNVAVMRYEGPGIPMPLWNAIAREYAKDPQP